MEARQSNLDKRYFEGYTAVNVPKANGEGTQVKNIYAGNYYSQDLSTKKRIAIRLLYFSMLFCVFFSFLFASTKTIKYNQMLYRDVLQGFSILGTMFLLFVLCNYCIHNTRMTVYEYKMTSLCFQKGAKGMAIVMLGQVIAVLLTMLWLGRSEILPTLYVAVSYVISSICFFCMYRMERSIPYKTERSY